MGSDDDDKPTTIVQSTTSSLTAMDLYRREAGRAAFGIPSPFIIREYERAPDDHAIYSLVGRVASEWAHFEHTLDIIIWDLAGIDQQEGACITAQMIGAVPRLKTILTQLRHKANSNNELEKFISKISKLQGQIHGPQEERNRIVHDPWYVTWDGNLGLLMRDQTCKPAQFKSMPHKEPRFGIEDQDVTKIKDTLTAIKNLAARANDLRKQISVALEASRRIRP